MMIVDLQGNGNVLTDPQIHCLDKQRFGKGNLGEAGISMFFYSHHCNEHCKSLGLVNPRLTGVLHPGFKLIADPEEKKINYNEQINKLCELCRKPYSTNFGYYCRQMEQGYETWCYSCNRKRNESMKESRCKVCSRSFKFSSYWYMMKKSDVPEACHQCR
jgi:hypothetical protein